MTPTKIRLLPPSAHNPRNSEGSMVELADGRLFFAYTRFYGGDEDHSPATIAAILEAVPPPRSSTDSKC